MWLKELYTTPLPKTFYFSQRECVPSRTKLGCTAIKRLSAVTRDIREGKKKINKKTYIVKVQNPVYLDPNIPKRDPFPQAS